MRNLLAVYTGHAAALAAIRCKEREREIQGIDDMQLHDPQHGRWYNISSEKNNLNSIVFHAKASLAGVCLQWHLKSVAKMSN